MKQSFRGACSTIWQRRQTIITVGPSASTMTAGLIPDRSWCAGIGGNTFATKIMTRHSCLVLKMTHKMPVIWVSPGFANIRAEGVRWLHNIVDPTAANAQAFADQDALIEHYRGKQAIRKMQGLYFNYTPISDETS
jgi:hypothetical protein